MKSKITGKEINLSNIQSIDYWQVYATHPDYLAGYAAGYEISYCSTLSFSMSRDNELHADYDISTLGIIWLNGFYDGVESGMQDT